MASSTTIVNPTIFREYIGSKPYPDGLRDFPDIINPNINEFHFIIAFAAEKYDESGRGTGEFNSNWTVPPIDGQMIRRLKNRYENVKVVISIGGRGSNYPFNPAAPEIWPVTASASLIRIINELNAEARSNVIDGIDINYDTINPGDVNVFSGCIGTLINILRSDYHWVNAVVSIAPSFSVNAHYVALYATHRENIDWVNYQFYTDIPAFALAHDFEERYRQLANEEYPGGKLLAGFSTDPFDAGHLSRVVFLDGCEVLRNAGELPGIFVWNANDSFFPMEREAQNLLAPRLLAPN